MQLFIQELRQLIMEVYPRECYRAYQSFGVGIFLKANLSEAFGVPRQAVAVYDFLGRCGFLWWNRCLWQDTITVNAVPNVLP